MKVTLQNTSKVVNLVINGAEVPARVWEGVTESGVKCHAFITRINVAEGEDASQFEKELREMAPPSLDVDWYPLRLIL